MNPMTTSRQAMHAFQAVFALICLVVAVGSAQAQTAALRVGSKIDTEGSLLGNLMIQVLEAGGIRCENKLQLGNTKIVRAALVSGEIDLYPEYTGNGAFFHADEKNPAWRKLDAGWQRVQALDQEKHKLIWLAPAPANNTWAIAIRKDVAASNNLKTLADFGKWVSGGGRIKLAASAEFAERADALPAFQAAYGFKLKQDQLLLLAGGDTATTIKAAAQQTSGVNAAMAYGTDGPVAALGLVVLEDPLGVQPVYAPAVVVRSDVLAAQPMIALRLNPLFKTLDTATLQRLNAQIALEGRDPKQVAAAYLKSSGLLK